MEAGRKKLVSEKVLCEITGWELSKVRNDRWRKRGINYFKLGRSVRYDEAEIYEYLQRCKVQCRDGAR